MGYFKSGVYGISWVGGFRVFTRIISFLRTIILARILVPAQFGVYGIATIVLSFLEIFIETGINMFLLQEKKNIDKYINTAWVISLFRGFLIGILILSVNPIIVSFFNTPELSRLLIILSLVPIARGFINPSVVKFQKELSFSKDFFYRSSVFFIDSLMSVFFTLYLKSPSGILWGLLVGAIYEAGISWFIVKPRPKFVFEFKKAKTIIDRGKWVTLAGIFNYLTRQGDDVVVAKMLNNSSLGIYQVAFKLSTLPLTEVTQVFNRVTLPIFVKISDDKKRLWRAAVKTFLATSFLALTFGAFLYLSAGWIIPIFLGDAWSAAIPVVKVLTIFGVLRALTGVPFSVNLSVEKQQYNTNIILIELVTMALLIIPFIRLFGLVGAGYATIISVLASMPLTIYYLFKVFK